MKKVVKIDEQGLFLEDVLIRNSQELPEDCVDVEIPEGFYHPRFVDGAWVEGLTAQEIDELKNTPKPQTQEDRIALLEGTNKQLSAKLEAAVQSNAFLEECLVEMAGVVYAAPIVYEV